MAGDDRHDEPSEPVAEPIELDPRPRVVRLNRRALLVAGGLLVGVALAAILTLSKGKETAGEAGGSRDMAASAPERFWEKEPDVIPRLPPEEPAGDASEEEKTEVPVLPENGSGPGLLGSSQDAERQELERAMESPLVVFTGTSGAAPARGAAVAHAPPVGGATVDPSQVLRAARDLVPAGPDAEDPVVTQNLQREKAEFLRSSRLSADDEVLAARVRPAMSPYEVKAGSLVPAVLVTQANSDLPGQLIAQVRENVYDTATGAHLLIPQGTRTIGTYDSLVAYGQERLLVAWQRLLFPDGSSLNLETMPGVDVAGAAGFEDRVNHHYWRVFGGAFLLSAISAGLQISQGTFSGSGAAANGEQDLREILAAALGQNLGDLATEIARRNMNVQPTIEVRAGYRFNIAVMKDLVFPGPYLAE